MTTDHPLQGLLPVLATPFNDDGTLDGEGLRRLVRFQIACGADGVAVFGMASEGFALTTRDREQVLSVVVDEARGRVPVIAGVNATSTATAIEQAVAAADLGAEHLMVLPSYLVKATPAQLFEFYTDVADATPAQVMLQDAPGPTGVTLPVGLIADLSRHRRITSVKIEAPPTAPKVSRLAGELGDDAVVIGGQNAFFLVEELRGGAVGTMPACEFTDALGPVLSAASAGDWARARAEHTRLLPLIRFGMQGGIAWAVHKQVLVRRGVIASARVRLPAQPLDEASASLLDDLLDDLDLPAYAAVVQDAA